MRRTGVTTIDLGGSWESAVAQERLHADWSMPGALRTVGPPVHRATVPGNVELDLLANGLIEDPFVGMNIVGLRWLERCYVYYARDFEAPAQDGSVAMLRFEGLDCVATVYLNGVPILETDDMLIEHEVCVDGVLRPGATNTLVVELHPVLDLAASPDLAYPPGLVAEGSGYEGLYVRKAPHMFGWDIMPRALSAGIWRPVSLSYLPPTRFDWVWLDTRSIDLERRSARMTLHFRASGIRDPQEWRIRVEGVCGDSVFSRSVPLLFGAGAFEVSCADARFWWPRGRGDPDLYDVRVQLLRGDALVDELRFEHGIRTVSLDRTSVTSETGDGEFCLRVNGERLFVLGTNWVPLDAYHSRDAERLDAAFALLLDIGCNAVRCWGGNVYESDRFFELCDRHGIVVWQDFAMACAMYPQDPRFQVSIEREARQVVRRLRQHPSVVLWAGDNECDQKYLWNGRRRDPNGNVLTRVVIPGVLREEDPSRPYLPSSPYVDEVAYLAGERYLPEDHLWGPRDHYKSPFYSEALAHFASEIGYHGCPSPDSIRRFITPGRLWPFNDNEEWLLHATSPIPGVDIHDYRVRLMADQVKAMFGHVPDTLEAFAVASQATQAEALKTFIEAFRAQKWRRTGIIWWNLVDGWPQASDALVDYYWSRKRAYEVVKRCQAPILVVVREPVARRHEVVVCNDTRTTVPIHCEIREPDGGRVVARLEGVAAADAVTSLGWLPVPSRPVAFALAWQTSLGEGRSHYLAGDPPFVLADYLRWVDGSDPAAEGR
jgi:beta-mannosidase